MQKISSRDRSSLIRLASSFQKGSEERRAILAGLVVAEQSLMEMDERKLPRPPSGYSWETREGGMLRGARFVLKHGSKEVGYLLLAGMHKWEVYLAGLFGKPKGHSDEVGEAGRMLFQTLGL